MSNPSRAASFRTDIQGLRAIAVGIVLAYHAGFASFSGGFVGVDVFFVISGFLITQHLVAEMDRTGRLSFRQFYARRARRILPAALAVVAVTTVLSAILLPPIRALEVLRDAVATILFVPNYWFAWTATDYLTNTDPSPFQHYWSLGVEEQFYLLWPLLIMLCVVVFRGRKALPLMLGVLAVASFVSAEFSLAGGPTFAFYSVTTRAWEFAVGGIVALLVMGAPGWLVRTPNWLRAAAGWIGLGGIVASTLVYNPTTHFPGVGALAPVLGAGLIILAGSVPTRGGPDAVLRLRALQFIGLISYSLYLVHWPILNLTEAVRGKGLSIPVALVLLAVSVPIAYGVHRFVEKPFLAPRRESPMRPRVVLGTAAAAVALSLALTAGASFVVSAQPLTSANPVDLTSREATPYVPTNLTPSLDDAESSVASIYSTGCHAPIAATTWKDCRFGARDARPVVALFGDSHAAGWFPTLEKLAIEHGFELRTFTKSACHAADVASQFDGAPYPQCALWRHSVIDELTAHPPDLVIITDRSYDSTPGDSAQERADGLTRTVTALAATSTVVVLSDTPRFPSDRATCLSEHLDDALACAGDLSVLPSEANAATRTIATAAGAEYIDLSGSFCFDSRCPAIIGPYLVYRDDQHISVEFARSLSDEVWKKLQTFIN